MKSIFNFLILLIIPWAAFSQDHTISGSVIDENGDGLPGATVIIKGTTIGTVTDINGDFF